MTQLGIGKPFMENLLLQWKHQKVLQEKAK